MNKVNIGKCGCPGIVEGRIVHSLDEEGVLILDTLKPSEYLNPSKTKGVIMKRGGILSHGAIVAREFNIPCIVGAGELPKLEEGTRVRLNATEEYFEILD